MFKFLRKYLTNEEITIPNYSDRRTIIGIRKPPFTWDIHEPEYITNRLGPFINFFDQQKEFNRLKEQILQYFIIGLGALIPIINILGIEKFSSNILSAIFGGGIAALTAILQFEKYHDRWISFKHAGTNLSKEYNMWKNCSGVYALRDSEAGEEIKNVINAMKKSNEPERNMDNSKEEQEKDLENTKEKVKMARLVRRSEDIITSEAFDFVALFSDTNISRRYTNPQFDDRDQEPSQDIKPTHQEDRKPNS